MFIIFDSANKISHRFETEEEIEKWFGLLTIRVEDIIKRFVIYKAEKLEYTVWATVKCKIDSKKDS